MTASERDEFRTRMGEAAACEVDDARRRDVERLVSGPEAWARDEWRALLAENVELRRALPEIDVPSGLEARLLGALPDTRSRRVWPWAAAAAAVVLVAVGLLLIDKRTTNSRLRTVALLAIDNHLNHLDEHEQGSPIEDPVALASTLTGKLPFEVAVPELGGGMQLVGGRTCKLGTHRVAFLLWRGDGGRASIFQFRPEEFGLPTEMARQQVGIEEPAGSGRAHDASVWVDGGRGYVLVEEPAGP